ncbi:MAG: hypothetical protein OHK0039_06470 [Bacteroidia bacterium]
MLCSLLLGGPLLGQAPVASPALALGVNADAFGSMHLRYLHPLATGRVPLAGYVSCELPLMRTIERRAFDAWTLRLGSLAEVWRSERWLLLGGAHLSAIHHRQVLGRFVSAGAELKLTPACLLRRGYLGLQLRYSQSLGTHIQHSAYAQERFEDLRDASGERLVSGPRDGWYRFTGSRLLYGLEGDFRLGQRLALYADLGMIHFFSPYTKGFDAMMFGQVPFYLDLRLAWRLGGR